MTRLTTLWRRVANLPALLPLLLLTLLCTAFLALPAQAQSNPTPGTPKGKDKTDNPDPTALPGGVPGLAVTRTPKPMVAGQSYTVTWSSSRAERVSYACSGGGYTGSGQVALNGSMSGTASSAWVGQTSTCTWTAENAYGFTDV
ncbi:MAG TPA: hypothetical protein VEC06_04885, partial [Paucimonas sp.]|nr:hypothetical protein [Paucimonas sp.]